MKAYDLAFIPGKQQMDNQPLSRFLPPVPADIGSQWLAAHIPAGAWVLEPFSALPAMIVEAARAGYRVLAAANNPISSFMIETMAAAPTSGDMHAALAELASVRKGDERLEPHIQGLYATGCTNCKNTIQATAFIWQRDGQKPETCLVECPHCGDKGEKPVSPDNLARLGALGRGSLHRARALERVTAMDDPIRPHVEQALNCYLPRPIYAMVTMINRLESLPLSPDRLRLATALLLSACDEANSIWPYPASRQRPRQLYIPAAFRENNLWLALENAVDQWQSSAPPVPLTVWPDLPPESGGICLYKGRMRDLPVDQNALKIEAILCAIPRPNQAFWTLSAVWAGWLWGRDAVTPLKSSLSRQRYDWNWHTVALESNLSSLRPQVPVNTPMFGLVGEVEPSYLLATLISARDAGFDLQGSALRSDQSICQLYWLANGQKSLFSGAKFSDRDVKEIIRRNLESRAEPSPYLSLFTAAAIPQVVASDRRAVEFASDVAGVSESPTRMLADIHRFFSDPNLLVRYGGTSQSFERTYWWLANSAPLPPSLSDRVEIEVVRTLQHSPGLEQETIDSIVCQVYKGWQTPTLDLIQMCLESYAEAGPGASRGLVLRTADMPSTRRAELASIEKLLQKIGTQLGYQTQGNNPVLWLDENGELAYAFYLIASGIIDQIVTSNPYPTANSIIVLPGSRANLVAYKLQHDPWLNQKIAMGWRFLKFRHLRLLNASLLPNRIFWDDQLNGDPLDYKALHSDSVTD